MKLTEDEILRYSRHIILPEVGGKGQKKIRSARVLVTDSAGSGASCSLYLAAAGVGTLGIVDCTRSGPVQADQTDLLGIIGARTLTGSNGADPRASVLQSLNPGVNVAIHPAGELPDLIIRYDIVVAPETSLDRWLEVNRLASAAGKPLAGALTRDWTGVLGTVVPGGSCLECLDWTQDGPLSAIFGLKPGSEGRSPGQSVLAETMGVLAATEAVKLILGIGRPLTGRVLIYSGLDQTFREVPFNRRSTCPVCGPAPSVPTGVGSN